MNQHRVPKPHPDRRDGDPFVLPPGHHINYAGHHWLRMVDFDGHSNGTIVLQWQPHARKWCHSNNFSTGRNYDNVDYYLYVAPCPMPLFEDEQERLRKLLPLFEKLGDGELEASEIDLRADDWTFLRKILASQVD